MKILTNLKDFTIRFAEIEDVPLILEFIKELAEYEHMSEDVVATEEILTETIFHHKKAEVLIGEYQQKPVAFALFFHNFSTFLGRPGIYLEDLFVKPEARGMGIGTIMLSYLATLTKERNCGRLEWSCLDWNEPSIKFYKQMGSTSMDEWTVYRVHGQSLTELAKRFQHQPPVL
jgi:GNAT superfamily N-acetyltransferase